MTTSMNASESCGDIEISDQAALIKHPVVSVLMLAYKHGAYLALAIESVLTQQTNVPIELLIGEDCSPDDTREIAFRYQHKYPETIRVFISEKNIGPTLNHRRILCAARGKFLAYLDGDDYWLPGKLERQVAFMKSHPEYPAVYANAVAIREDGKHIGIFNDAGDSHHDLASLYRYGNFLNSSSMLYRAEFKQELLAIEHPFIDYHMHLLLARHGSIAHMGLSLVAYRVNSTDSMTVISGDLVREQYWEALHSVPVGMLDDIDRARGLADFLRRVFGTARRQRRWSLLRIWAPRVFTASPYGRLRTSLLAINSLMRIACLEAIHQLRMVWRRDRSRVLYHR